MSGDTASTLFFLLAPFALFYVAGRIAAELFDTAGLDAMQERIARLERSIAELERELKDDA